MIELTDKNFEKEVIGSRVPCLVDFWASWCSPCKVMEPVLHGLAKEYKEKVKFCKLNVDDNSDTPTKYSIRSIPTILLFKGGELVDTIVGVTPRETIAKKLDDLLTG